MIARGRVQNGVVVLEEGVRLPDEREVTVSLPADIRESPATYEVSDERRAALLGLIGIYKKDNPPNDEEVERIIEEARMKKYG